MTATRPRLTNWAGNHRYRATELHRPETLDELRRLVAGAASLRVLGTRHTFTSIGDADALVALHRLPLAREIAIDAAAMTVSVGPAVTYAQLAEALGARALALPNLASLPHISVVGAVATASHGSGDRQSNLATSVVGVRLLTSEGETIDVDRADHRFPGVVVHLGALGVVTRVTLAVVPAYELRQDVYDGLEWRELFAQFDAIMGAGRSVSVFHRFGEHPREVWVKRDPDRPPADALARLRPATSPRHPVPGADPANCTAQLGQPGPWSERLPHFRSGFTPSSGAELQSELFVARGDVEAAIAALTPLAPRMDPVLFIAELRTIAADELWLSPHHGRDSTALHFTWHRRSAEVEAVLAEVERVLAPLDARPHWGKLFCAGPDALAAQYPRLVDFRALRAELDPRDTFSNAWLRERVLGD